MKYEIFGGSFPAATVTLNKGEKVFTQSGAMAWADDDIKMSTNMEGGFLKSLGRAFSGASLMFVTHEATRDDSKVTFSSSFPGTIKEFKVDANHEYIAQKSAFLVADPGVNVDATVNKNFWAGLFGGEGIVMQRYSGEGSLLAEIDGSAEEVELKAGETIKVETGHVALFDSTVSYNIESVKGFNNILFGGQGLFFTTLTGPGRVWLQTLTAQDMAQKIMPYIPQSTTTVSTSHSSSSNSNN
ncbi:MAG: TIGR00266 family protein [Erysipelotrichaceae bacterium]|nr:TIGR00266 family protein [Erysipelotrichaceae bacterium]